MTYNYFKELWLHGVVLWHSLARRGMGVLGGTSYSNRADRRAHKKTFGIGKKL